MFIIESSKNAKKQDLLKLEQSEIIVDKYEIKLRTLCYLYVNMDITIEAPIYQMLDNGIHCEIKIQLSPVYIISTTVV